MKFDNIIQNKVTEFSCRHGDETCKVTYEYDIEGIEDMINAFETIAKFLGYSNDVIKTYYKEINEE